MIRLLARYGKLIWPLLLGAIVLLALQAWGDLSLPSYMSDIMNVGIQQQGVESVVPLKAGDKAMYMFTTALDEGDAAYIKERYTRRDGTQFETPPLDMDGEKAAGVWELNDISAEDTEALNNIFSKVIKNIALSRGVSLEGMPDSALLSAAAPIYHEMYKNLGMDVDKMQTDYILKTGLKMLALSFLIMAAVILSALLGARIAATVGKHARLDVFSKAIRFSNAEFDSFSASTLITRSTNDVQQIQNMIPLMLRTVIYAPIIGIGGVLKVLGTEASMTWIIGLAVAVLLAVIIFMILFALPKFNVMQKIVDKVNLIMREALSGMFVIRAFNTQKHEEARFDKANKELTGITLFVGRLMSSMFPIMMIIMNGTTLLIVWVGAKKIAAADIQAGDMMAFIQYAMQVIMSFLFISVMAFMLPRAQVACKRINEVLDKKETVLDPVKPEAFSPGLKGEINFNHVSFKYPDADEYVLRDINFTAKAGETTAFIGSTGSGKSTLVNLIPRFYDITEGSLTVDGADIRNVKKSELRRKIGYVPQKGVLFTGTIGSNIKFAEGAGDDDMVKAAAIAQAEDFINEKELKYEDPVAQGGGNVSGGQRQRLAIARALAVKPEVYIFDDSFSALDFRTDAALRAALAKEIGGATVLIVASRIGTIKSADRIVVLDEGEVVGIGRHKELLESCEVYKQIALSQLSQEELDRDLEAATGIGGALL